MGVIMPFDRNFRYGEGVFNQLIKEMPHGAPIMHSHDIGMLAQMVCDCDGDHLEIGTAHGGSAIAAALAMSHIDREGKVVCIDPMEGDLAHSSLDMFWENAKHFGVEDRIEFYQAKSNPYPLEDRKFGTALIDGDHSTKCVIEDWKNASKVTLSYVMLHDYDQIHGVRKAVYQTVIPDENWIVSTVCGWSLLMKRIKWT